MKILKHLLRSLFFLLFSIIIYLLIALLLSSISVNTNLPNEPLSHTIYLSTNGIHLDVVLPAVLLEEALKEDLQLGAQHRYCAFGWGDHDFYLNTPTWRDLTFWNAFKALLLPSNTLMHVTRYSQARKKWCAVPISETQLNKLNNFIQAAFQLDATGKKVLLTEQGYYQNDDFYEALGSYSGGYNCNSWTNDAFKTSGLKACYWTPFDFSLLRMHQ